MSSHVIKTMMTSYLQKLTLRGLSDAILGNKYCKRISGMIVKEDRFVLCLSKILSILVIRVALIKVRRIFHFLF